MLFCLIVEDTVVAMSVTGILKVWIITAEVSRMQVNCRLHMLSFQRVHLFCVRAIYCVCSGLGPSVWRRIQTCLLSGLSEHFLLHLHSEESVGHLFKVLEGKRLCDYHSHQVYGPFFILLLMKYVVSLSIVFVVKLTHETTVTCSSALKNGSPCHWALSNQLTFLLWWPLPPVPHLLFVLGVWCCRLLAALLSSQWKWPELDRWRVYCCRQSYNLDWRWLQLRL